MEIIAQSKFIRMSPRKISLVAKALRGLKASEALEILKNLNKKAAEPMLLTLKQGIANAINNFKLDKSTLVIKKIEIGKGVTYKRGQPISRGQWHPILKRTSHLRLVIEGEKVKKGAKNGTKG